MKNVWKIEPLKKKSGAEINQIGINIRIERENKMVMDREERDRKRDEIRDAIISSKEALEILGFTRVRLSQIVADGRIVPIRSGIYLKDDILAFKENRDS